MTVTLNLPKTMRAAVLKEVKAPLAITCLPVPEIGAEDALVRIRASGICRSDWHMWNGDWKWFLDIPTDMVLGHEISGEIVAVGSAVKRIKIGQRVTIPFNLACGHCPYCQAGSQNLCDHMASPSFVEGGGGFAEFTRIPTADLNCIVLPDEVDFHSAAALGCRYMTAWRAVRDRAQIRAGESVAVFGCGGVGLAAIEICTALGGIVIAVDIDEQKLEHARKTGAQHTVSVKGLSTDQIADRVRAATGGLGACVSIDALGGSKTTLPGLSSLRKGGRLVQIGLTGMEDAGQISYPADDIVNKEYTILGSLGNPHHTFTDLLGLVAIGRLRPNAMVSRTVKLTEVNHVLSDMGRFATSGYVLITNFLE
ncbi:D-arabinose 1-dehydrogenase-like Zn-dependent alcohol dehydrogenase [Rhizobium leguminosarum]|uniref:alcohol dehydrogenase catalytic domain-containing protein n=1 Tax=Rhizobium leguminosarum TaxID=384 RepID=UPI0024B32B18|nr:alcohol dehydrogenase catalytic domain-containing protein [Rhizobium leguminosarum]WHO82621.1 alcohol dehydrogenase catalytic domain-containing protein [Rhizobium leguminosarum]